MYVESKGIGNLTEKELNMSIVFTQFSFPNLRIVKKKADELKDHGNLIVFDSSSKLLRILNNNKSWIYFLLDDNSSPQLASVKDTIKEYQLEKSQLAFTILNKVYINDAVTVIAYAHTTTFSEVMVENINRDPDANNSPSESTCLRSSSLKRPYCSVYKYAPRQGYADSNSEVLIFYRNKLKSDRYGGKISVFYWLTCYYLYISLELQVTFEYHGPLGHWQAPVLELEVRDQMVSFITPHFPFKINSITPVNVVIKQQKRTFDQLQYRYIPKNSKKYCLFLVFWTNSSNVLSLVLCQHCEARLSHMPEPLTQDIPTTSRVADWSIDDEDL